jgi:hemolysin III
MQAHAQSSREEVANALTHGAGVVLSVGGGAALITLAAVFGDGWQIGSAIAFSLSLVLLYTASTLYHAIPHARAKARLKVFDHCAIFVLIAGTYTPFALIGLRGADGYALFAVIWSLALAGIVFKLYCTGKYRRLSTLMYVCMGWLAIFAAEPMLAKLPTAAILWLLAGGVAYTAGTAFYHARLPYAHAIWHGFVLCGSVCHFAAVVTQVVP